MLGEVVLDLVVRGAQQLTHAAGADQVIELLVVLLVCPDLRQCFDFAGLDAHARLARQTVLFEAGLTDLLDVLLHGLLVLGIQEFKLLSQLLLVRD